MRHLLFFTIAAAVAVSQGFAQPLLSFQSSASGEWTDSRNWEKNDGGIWLKSNTYPGDQYDRTADVTVRDGSTVTVGKDEVVRINSLLIADGRVLVEGTLIIGPEQNEIPPDTTVISPTIQTSKPVAGDAPQLLQNMPNPLAPQFGYETTIRFYLDKQYPNARLIVFDQLGHTMQKVFDETNPASGWHEIKVRLDNLQSGSYPLILELPNGVLEKIITVMR